MDDDAETVDQVEGNEAEADESETQPVEQSGEMITYRPRDGDPAKTKWRGIEFHAHVPVKVSHPEHIEAARGNSHFSVGDEQGWKQEFGQPKNAMEYRAHVVDWMKGVERVDDLAAKWAADRDLRSKCEVGQDDISYLGTLFEPKLKHMRLSEGLSETDVAGVFVRRGILALPWRA